MTNQLKEIQGHREEDMVKVAEFDVSTVAFQGFSGRCCVWMCVNGWLYMCVCVCVCTCMHACVCVRACMCVFVCETDRQTDKQPDSQPE